MTANSVEVIGFEIVQSIQTKDGRVGIFAGRDTAVRCYVKPTIDRDMSAAAGLSVRHPGGAARYTSVNGPDLLKAGHPRLEAQRRNLDHSFLFVLPGDAVKEGKHEFTLDGVVSPQSGALTISSTGNAGSFEAIDGPVLRVRAIGIRMKVPKPDAHLYPPDAAYYYLTPRSGDFSAVEQFLRRSFPISKLEWNQTIIDAPEGFEPPFEDSALDAAASDAIWARKFSLLTSYMMAIRSEEIETGVDGKTHYYGIVPDRSFTGAAMNVPESARPDIIAIGPGTGDGELAGHEFGHALGGLHVGPEFGGDGQHETDPGYPASYRGLLSGPDEAAHGLDLGAKGELPRVLPRDRYYDLMSYNSPRWPSLYNYESWRKRLEAENKSPRREQGKGGQFLMAAGVYNLAGDGSGSIDYVRTTQSRPAAPPEAGDVRVVALDAQDRVVGSCFVEGRNPSAIDLPATIAAYSIYIEKGNTAPVSLALEVNNRRVQRFDLPPDEGASANLALVRNKDAGPAELAKNPFSVRDADAGVEMSGFELAVDWPETMHGQGHFTVQIEDGAWKTVSAAANPSARVYFLDPFLERGRTYNIRIRRQFTKRTVLEGEVTIPAAGEQDGSESFKHAAE